MRNYIKQACVCIAVFILLICSACGNNSTQIEDNKTSNSSINNEGEASSVYEEEETLDDLHVSDPYIDYIIDYYPDGREKQKQYFDLSGNVIETTNYTYDKEMRLLSIATIDVDGNVSPEKECSYDDAGNITLERTYLWGGKSYYKEWFYDDNNNCIEYIFNGSSGNILERCLSYYGENGLIQEVIYRADDETTLYAEDDEYGEPYYLSSWEIVFYDEKGNVGRVEYYEPDGNYYWDNCYPSDDKNTSYVETYDMYGNLISYQESSFDDNGNRLTYLSGQSRENLTLHFEFEYDDNGNEILMRDYDESGNLNDYTIFEYDTNGNLLIEATYNKDNVLLNKWFWIYNEHGNVIFETHEDENGTITEHTCPQYEYDENGCLIREIHYETP